MDEIFSHTQTKKIRQMAMDVCKPHKQLVSHIAVQWAVGTAKILMTGKWNPFVSLFISLNTYLKLSEPTFMWEGTGGGRLNCRCSSSAAVLLLSSSSSILYLPSDCRVALTANVSEHFNSTMGRDQTTTLVPQNFLLSVQSGTKQRA